MNVDIAKNEFSFKEQHLKDEIREHEEGRGKGFPPDASLGATFYEAVCNLAANVVKWDPSPNNHSRGYKELCVVANIEGGVYITIPNKEPRMVKKSSTLRELISTLVSDHKHPCEKSLACL